MILMKELYDVRKTKMNEEDLILDMDLTLKQAVNKYGNQDIYDGEACHTVHEGKLGFYPSKWRDLDMRIVKSLKERLAEDGDLDFIDFCRHCEFESPFLICNLDKAEYDKNKRKFCSCFKKAKEAVENGDI